jgi:hypothetical protein
MDGHLSMYERSSTRHKILSSNASVNERSASDDEGIANDVESTRQEMKRACPVRPNNHANGRKKQRDDKSSNDGGQIAETHRAPCAGTGGGSTRRGSNTGL